MSDEHPEVRRQRQRDEIRSTRGSAERLDQIAAIAAEKARAQQRSGSRSSGRKSPSNSADMFGHRWPEWFQMRDTALQFLESVAAEKRLTSYGEVWGHIGKALDTELGSHWRQLPNLLGYVSVKAFAAYELVPTALVVTPGQDGPEAGFFRIAVELGDLDDSHSPEEGEPWTMSDAQRTYWNSTVEQLFARFG